MYDSCMFFWSLKASDCAAWVQAWGTIAAVLAAFGVARWSDARGRRHRLELAIRHTRTLCGSVAGLIAQGIKMAPSNNLAECRRLLAATEEVLITGRTIETELLDLEWTAAVVRLRSVCAQLAEYLRSVKQEDLTGYWASRTEALFRSHDEEVDKITDVVAKEHPGIRIRY